MGWCHEFGPQINDGCDHPMVAGTAACSCAHCGSTCHGKFAGCAGVWARGPRPVIVGVTAENPRPTLPQGALGAEAHQLLEGRDIGASTLDELERELGMGGHGDDHPPASVLAELAQRLDALEERLTTLAEHQRATGDEGTERGDRIEAALVGLTERMGHLSEQVIDLQTAPVPPVDVEATGSVHVEELVGRMREHLDRLSGRVAELETQPGATAVGSIEAVVEHALEGVDQRVERLSSKVGSLETLSSRIAGLEGVVQAPQEKLTEMMSERLLPFASVLTTLRGLPERLAALEDVAAPADQSTLPPGLVEDVGRLSAQVAMLSDVPKKVAVVEEQVTGFPDATIVANLVKGSERIVAQLDLLSSQMAPMHAVPKRIEAVERAQGRTNALEKVVAGLVQGEQQRSAARATARLSALGDLPERLEALEQFPSAPTGKLVGSLTQRVDLLDSHVAQMGDVPDRLAALEVGSSARSEIVQKLFLDIGAKLNAQELVLQGLRERLEALDASAARTSALAGGLGTAIDMLDQLSAQVASLERAQAKSPMTRPPPPEVPDLW